MQKLHEGNYEIQVEGLPNDPEINPVYLSPFTGVIWRPDLGPDCWMRINAGDPIPLQFVTVLGEGTWMVYARRE
jgi:hypothetical protein